MNRATWVRMTFCNATVAVLLFAGCGSDPTQSLVRPESAPTAAGTIAPTATITSGEPLEPGSLEAPPPVTVNYFDQSVVLHAWTYCYKNGCADGAPPKNPYHIGNPEEVRVEYPLDGWSFNATFAPADEKCGREQTTSLETTGEGEFVLRPVGHADTYDVTLFGRGNGDLFTTFRWTTPVEGPLPEPRARLAVIANNDGEPDSYGVELYISNLERSFKDASATIEVRAANGNAIEFEAEGAGGGCYPEGTIYWDGPDDKGLEAAGLGDPPFTYNVRLELDGRRYLARAVWPEDEIKGNEPSVRLEFTPELPAPS